LHATVWLLSAMNGVGLTLDPEKGSSAALIEALAREIRSMKGDFVTRVAIDGVDGAGKTHFADELARVLERSGAGVIRASVDGFHHPRAHRYSRGRYSAEGFYRDSYDYPALQQALLDPLSPGGSGQYLGALFDFRADAPVVVSPLQAAVGDILIFDGVFLHRPELRGYWDLSIFLEASFERSIERLARRDGGPTDPTAALNRRYVEGQQLYLRECSPRELATLVINNDDPDRPDVLRWRTGLNNALS
jgi:uridine kinase